MAYEDNSLYLQEKRPSVDLSSVDIEKKYFFLFRENLDVTPIIDKLANQDTTEAPAPQHTDQPIVIPPSDELKDTAVNAPAVGALPSNSTKSITEVLDKDVTEP